MKLSDLLNEEEPQIFKPFAVAQEEPIEKVIKRLGEGDVHKAYISAIANELPSETISKLFDMLPVGLRNKEFKNYLNDCFKEMREFRGASDKKIKATIEKITNNIKSMINKGVIFWTEFYNSWSGDETVMSLAYDFNMFELIRFLLEKGYKEKNPSDFNKHFMKSIKDHKEQAQIDLFIQAGAKLDTKYNRSGYQETPMRNAFHNSDVKTIEALMQRGVQLPKKEDLTYKLFHTDEPAMIDLLVRNGAEINGQSKGTKADSWSGRMVDVGLTPITSASRNFYSSSWANSVYIPVIRRMLKHGADPRIKNRSGVNAYHYIKKIIEKHKDQKKLIEVAKNILKMFDEAVNKLEKK